MSDRNTLKRNLMIALFAALMAAGAYIRVPIGPVPIVLSTMFVIMAGAVLGPAAGSIATAVHLIMGAVGIPVFAGGSGPAVFAGPTGGYLIAYIPATFICGLISADTDSLKEGLPVRDITAVVAASLLLYAIGVPWLKWRLGIDWGKAFSIGMLPFLIGDAVKAAAVVAIRTALVKRAPELLPNRS